MNHIKNIKNRIELYLAKLLIKLGVAMGAEAVTRKVSFSAVVLNKDGSVKKDLGIISKGVSNV